MKADKALSMVVLPDPVPGRKCGGERAFHAGAKIWPSRADRPNLDQAY